MSDYSFNNKIAFSQGILWKEGNNKKAFKSMRGLINWVAMQRFENGGDLTPGWKDRLVTSVCEAHPELNGCIPTKPKERRVTLSDITLFFHAMKKWQALDRKFVPQALADKRAKICSECEFNVPIVGCWGCANIIPRILKMMKDKPTPYDLKLQGCSVCGCQNSAKVHFPVGVMTDSAKDPKLFREGCWIKEELKAL